MPEIRVDPLSGAKVIVAGERSERPGGEPRCAAPAPIDVDKDPFAAGREDLTPPELYSLREGASVSGAGGDGLGGSSADSAGWSVRVVPNLYPALDGDSSPPPADAQPDLFYAMAAGGAHEVIINAPESVLSLAELPARRLADAMEVWRLRMAAHPNAAYVQLIVNERREAGASLEHTHAQLYALDFVPGEVARERERCGAYANRTDGRGLLEDLVAEEVRRGERIVAIDDEAVLMAPYGSKLPFQLMLAPRLPRARFEDDGPLGSALLHDGLTRLMRHFGCSPPLNMWVRTAPRGAEHFCWRIDVAPRLTHLAGLELSTGVNLNIVAPEHAAAVLRDA
jgi:UDPglucose--hexose-1-phosphate uridylyltransferase